MGHILGSILFMFPHDSVVTVEDVVIHEGQRHSIYIEVQKETPDHMKITTESIVEESSPLQTTIQIRCYSEPNLDRHYQFVWQGWIARRMELAFLEVGSVITQDILVSFCDLLVAIARGKVASPASSGHNAIPHKRLTSLLGPNSYLAMTAKCQDVLLATPSSGNAGVRTAFQEFSFKVECAIQADQTCSCARARCSLSSGWARAHEGSTKVECRVFCMWRTIGRLLTAGVLCFFINGSTAATVPEPTDRLSIAQKIIMDNLLDLGRAVSCQGLYASIMRMINHSANPALALSHGSTIYPTALGTLNVPSNATISFELLDGKLMFEGRYYDTLQSDTAERRPRAERSVTQEQATINPSNIGEHKSLLMTVREKADGLIVRTTFSYSGLHVRLMLTDVIMASFSLVQTSACSHLPLSPLQSATHQIVVTGISAPRASDKNAVAVVMTQWNPTAQLLSCEPGARMILMQDCCLKCALKEAADGIFKMIIVS